MFKGSKLSTTEVELLAPSVAGILDASTVNSSALGPESSATGLSRGAFPVLVIKTVMLPPGPKPTISSVITSSGVIWTKGSGEACALGFSNTIVWR